jgi:hypothetical protein
VVLKHELGTDEIIGNIAPEKEGMYYRFMIALLSWFLLFHIFWNYEEGREGGWATWMILEMNIFGLWLEEGCEEEATYSFTA